MTNTLHRQGRRESLAEDYVVFATTAAGVNKEGAGPKLKRFMELARRHAPVNMGEMEQGNFIKLDFRELLGNIGDNSGTVAATFDDIDKVEAFLGDLIQADLGISINVSGLMDEVHQCCRRLGIERHSGEHSLGFMGRTERLPGREMLELNTMCGHGMVSFNLISKMVELVKIERLTPAEAARHMARCCECGAFNPARAEKLLAALKDMG